MNAVTRREKNEEEKKGDLLLKLEMTAGERRAAARGHVTCDKSASMSLPSPRK